MFWLICLPVESANVLMYPAPVKSHTLGQACLAEELLKRGNNVCFIVHEDLRFPAMLEKLQGAQVVAFPRESYGQFANFEDIMDRIFEQSLQGKGDISQISQWLMTVIEDWCRSLLLESEEALSQLETIKADALITDYGPILKYPYLMSFRLGITTIAFGAYVEPWLSRTPFLHSFVPTYFLPFTDRMTFAERAKNAFVAFVMGFLSPLRHHIADAIEAYKVYDDINDIDSLVEQTSLWLHSTHVVLDYPKPAMPNVVAACGMTTEPGKQLFGDILDILNQSKEGIILVSFGSIASHFPPQITQQFISVFASFQEYTFIWRFDNKNNLSFPTNVVTKEWLPQNDLLARPGVKY